MKNNLITKILNSIILVGIIFTLLALLAIPLVTTAFFKSAYQILSSENSVVSLTYTCIYVCAIPYVIALFKLSKIAKTVTNKDPFNVENVKSLHAISICAFSEVLLFSGVIVFLINSTDFYKELFYLPISYVAPIFLVSFIAIFIGFLCLVVAKLLDSAIKIKDENDFTI